MIKKIKCKNCGMLHFDYEVRCFKCGELLQRKIYGKSRMKAKKEEKYLVIKRKDLENYFSQFTKGTFTTEDEQNNINCLTWNEVILALQNNNKYIVCNQDEPYADLIWQIILMGEDSKELERVVT